MTLSIGLIEVACAKVCCYAGLAAMMGYWMEVKSVKGNTASQLEQADVVV